MARKTQPSFFDQDSRLQDHKARREHGGIIRKGRRKLARPVNVRKPLHLTLHSSRARGEWSMQRSAYESRIKRLVDRHAEKNAVKILQYANSGNHLHLLIKARSRDGFKSFLRTISGLIARLVTGAVKGRSMGKFWDGLAYSRIVTWGRDLFNTRFYVVMNELESLNLWSRKLCPKNPAPG